MSMTDNDATLARQPVVRLCELLDEHGVEYYYPHDCGGMVKWSDGVLTYHAGNAFPCNDPTRTKLVMHVTYPTPEQAVEVMTGRGTCRNTSPTHFVCSECGYRVLAISEGKTGSEMPPRFCPHCGRRVVDA